MNPLKSVTQFKGIALFYVQTWILIFMASLLWLHSADVDIILDCNSGPSLFVVYIHIIYEYTTNLDSAEQGLPYNACCALQKLLLA